MNTADADVYKFLRYFTFLSVEHVEQIEAEDKADGGRPQAQRILAEEVTRTVHGEEGLLAAQNITEALFSGETTKLSEADFLQLKQDGIPYTHLLRSELTQKTFIQHLVDSGLATSGKQIKDALARGAVAINSLPVSPEQNTLPDQCFASDRAMYTRYFLVKMGKKTYHLVEVA